MRISSSGVTAMNARMYFDSTVAEKKGLRQVHKLRMEYLRDSYEHQETEFEWEGNKIKATKIEKKKTDLKCPTNAEIDEYNYQRDLFVSKCVLLEHGWQEYEKFCELHKLDPNLPPCVGVDGQCNMFCNKFGNCERVVVEDEVLAFVTQKPRYL